MGMSVFFQLPRRALVWAADASALALDGRTLDLADRLADETDFLVVVPDLYRGQVEPDPAEYNWHERWQYDAFDNVRKYLNEERAIQDNSALFGEGTGSYFALHLASDYMMKAAFLSSPEHVEVVANYGADESEEDLYSPGINNSPTAVYFALSADEGDEYKEGSLADQSIDDVRKKRRNVLNTA